MSDQQEQKLIPDATDVPEVNPFIDSDYIKDPEDLTKQVMSRFSIYKDGKALQLPLIYESIAMFSGQQNMWWNPAAGQLQAVPVSDATRSNAINNKIMSKCRAIIQRLTSFDPTAQCIPAGPSQLDVYSARMCKKLVESNHHNPNLGYQAEYEKFAEFVVVQGLGWLRTEFDPYGGRKTVTYREEPMWKDIQIEAQKEGQSAFDELGEWENNPMEELDENKEKTNQEGGKTSDPNLQDNESKSEDGQTESGGVNDEASETDESQEAQPDNDFESHATNPMGKADNSDSIEKPQNSVKRVPDYDSNGKQKMQRVPGTEKICFDGVVVKKAVGPMNMYYNPTITDWRDAPDCFEVEYMSIDEIKRKFVGCDDLSDGDAEANDVNPWLMLFQTVIAKNPYGQNTGIPVYMYFCKSNPDFPNGLKLIIIKDKMRVGIPMPTLNGDELPYDFSGYIHLPGGFWYMSLPMFLKNPQLILNKLLRQYLDHMNQFAVPKVVIRQDSRLTNEMTNGVEIIRYTTEAPKFENPQSSSTAHMEMIKYMEDTIDTNSGVNKTAEGNPPPNITSGDMTEAVTENDYQIHGPDIDRIASAITGSCNKEIRYLKDQGPDEMLARYIGPGGKWMVSKFKKSNFRNVSDVVFVKGKAANLSRGQNRKDIEMMLPIVTQQGGTEAQQKIIVDKALDHLMWGEEESVVTDLNKQENCILDLLAEMEESALNPQYNAESKMMPWHDLNVWKDQIETILLNITEFEQKPEITKNRLISLWKTVTTKLNQMQEQAQMKLQGAQPQGAKPGGPPTSGPPGAPPPPTGAGAKLSGLQQMQNSAVPSQIGEA